MKRFLAVILFSVFLFLTVSAFAYDSDYLIFTTCGSTKGIEHLFDGDTFSYSLFMDPMTLKAFFVENTFKDGKLTTLTLRADVKSKDTDNMLYFVLENGYIIKGHYDQNGYDFWIDFDHGSIKLHMADEFNTYFDYIGGKYAQEAP